MNDRADELIQRFLDRELDPAGAAELDRLLEDPAVEADFAAQVRLEADLAGLCPPPAQAARILQAVWALEAGRTRDRVVDQIPTGRVARRPRRRTGPPAGRRLPWLAAAGLLLALGGLAAWSGLFRSAEAEPWGRQLAGAGLLAWQDGTRIQVEAEGRVEVGADPALGKRLRLLSGRLLAQVAPQPSGRPLVIETPVMRATVVGTAFSLEHRAGRSAIAVSAGVVACEDLGGGASRRVAAGETWSLEAAPAAPAGSATGPGRILGFEVVDRDRQPLAGYAPLLDGAVLPFTVRRGVEIGIRIRTEPEAIGPVLVEIEQPGGKRGQHLERLPPYFVFSDRPEGEAKSRYLMRGAWRISARPADPQGRPLGEAVAIAFTVEDAPP